MHSVYKTQSYDINCAHCNGAIAQLEQRGGDTYVINYPLHNNLTQINSFEPVSELDLCRYKGSEVRSAVLSGVMHACLVKTTCLLCGEQCFGIQTVTTPKGLRAGSQAFDGTYEYDCEDLYASHYGVNQGVDPEKLSFEEVGIQMIHDVFHSSGYHPFWILQFHGLFKSDRSAIKSLRRILVTSLEIYNSRSWDKAHAYLRLVK